MSLLLTDDLFEDVSYVDASFSIDLQLISDFAPEIYNFSVDASFEIGLRLIADFEPVALTPGDALLDAKLNLNADFECETGLALQNPIPITRSVAAGAFTNQRYAPAKLFINDVEVPFLSAEINAPVGTLGKTISVELARSELAQLPDSAIFRLEIYQFVNHQWKTNVVLDGGALTSRSFRMSSGRNGLNISVKSSDSKLDRFPRNNLIVYDPSKAEVSTNEIEPLFTNTNEQIKTIARKVSVLTLYKLLDIAFVEGCGFAGVITDLPNYEIPRCDFSVVNSYSSAVAAYIGMYKPEFSVDENDNLIIQKNIDPLPEEFAPNAFYASRYPNFTELLENAQQGLDGYIVNYTASSDNYYIDRNLQAVANKASAGNVETTFRRKIREWFEFDNPDKAVRSELKQEIVETRRNGALEARETIINTFDRLGRSTGYAKTIETLLPDIDQPLISGSVKLAMLKTREESQKISYKINPYAPRQTVMSKIETIVKALLAVDSENTALDASGNDKPFPAEYQEVLEHGNLKPSMSKLFRELQNTTEYFQPVADGTVALRYEGYNLLQNRPKPSVTDVRSGDISVRNFQKQGQATVLRTGVTQAARNGRLEVLNCGGLPFYFAEKLAQWLLAHPPITGRVEAIGFDESIDRGVSFTLFGRDGENKGRFKKGGYQVVIKPDSIVTNIDALKV